MVFNIVGQMAWAAALKGMALGARHVFVGNLNAAPVSLRPAHAILKEMSFLGTDGVTLLGISVANLQDAKAVQLALPFNGQDRRQLDAAIDQVRTRFGTTSIGRTTLVKRPLRPEAPRLPGHD